MWLGGILALSGVYSLSVTLSGPAKLSASSGVIDLPIEVAFTNGDPSSKVVLRGEVSAGDLYLVNAPDFEVDDFPLDSCDGEKFSAHSGLAGLLRNATEVRDFSVLLEISSTQSFLSLLRYRGIGNFVDNFVISVHNTRRPCADVLDFWSTEISSPAISDSTLPEPEVSWRFSGFDLIGNFAQKSPSRSCLLLSGFGLTRLHAVESEISSPSDSGQAASWSPDALRVWRSGSFDRKFRFEISDQEVSGLLHVGLFPSMGACLRHRSVCGEVISGVNGTGLVGLRLEITTWRSEIATFVRTEKISDHQGRFCVLAPADGRLALETRHAEFFPYANSWAIGNLSTQPEEVRLLVTLRGLGESEIETYDFRSPADSAQAVAPEYLAERTSEVAPPAGTPWGGPGTCRVGAIAGGDFRSSGGFRLGVYPRREKVFGNLSGRATLWLRSSGILDEEAFVAKASETTEDANVVGLIWRGLGLRLGWSEDRRRLEIRGRTEDVGRALEELIRVKEGREGEFAVIDVEFEVGETRCEGSSVLMKS